MSIAIKDPCAVQNFVSYFDQLFNTDLFQKWSMDELTKIIYPKKDNYQDDWHFTGAGDVREIVMSDEEIQEIWEKHPEFLKLLDE